MKKQTKILVLTVLTCIGIVLFVSSFFITGLFNIKSLGLEPGTIVIPVTAPPGPTEETLQLRTFPFITTTPVPTMTQVPTQSPPGATNPQTPYNPPPNQNIPPPAGETPPAHTGQYCVDEEPTSVIIEACDDKTRCDIAHGAGGPFSSCGTVIGWAHVIMEKLGPTGGFGIGKNQTSSNLPAGIASTCYTAAPYSSYPSTFYVIDSYNLAGLKGFSRGPQATVGALESTWRATAGYIIKTDAQGVTPGYAIFTGTNHVGIVNTVELDSRGNGHMWFLHTGTSYYLGKFIIANWKPVASSTGHTDARFGGSQAVSPDSTQGETVCFGAPYRYDFKTRTRTQ